MPDEVIPDTPDTVRDIQDFLSHMHQFSVIWPHKCLTGCRACYLIERVKEMEADWNTLYEEYKQRDASLTTQLQQATVRAESLEKALERMKAPVSDEEWSGYASGFNHWRSTFDEMIAARTGAQDGRS